MIKTKAALATLALTAGLVAVASPAQAVSCGSGYLCFFRDSNGGPLLESVQVASRHKSICYQLAKLAQNETSYIVNNSAVQFYVYDGAWCQTTAGPVYPYREGPMAAPFQDSITSYFRPV